MTGGARVMTYAQIRQVLPRRSALTLSAACKVSVCHDVNFSCALADMSVVYPKNQARTMKFYVMAKSYNSYGGHTTLSPIGDFLLQGASDFGDAITEITVTLHFSDSGPPKKSLEQLFERHLIHRATLPKVTFQRAKKKVEIAIASDVMDGRDWKPSPRLSLPLFERGVAEVVESLSLLRRRVKSSDAFDLARFVSHCESALWRIPGSEEDLQDFAAEIKAADQARRDAMSPWEKLDIDWDDYHPCARQILDEPFYWDCTDDFSPNGNDTGADLLEAYRDWLKSHRSGQPLRFLEGLAKRWGYSGVDGMDENVLDEASIALAFADIKLRGECDGDARRIAMISVVRQRTLAEGSPEWPHRGERLKTLDAIERKLQQTEDKPSANLSP